MSDSLQPHRLHSPWNSSGQNTWVGNLSLLQGIFLTQGSNPAPPHCWRIGYQLSHQGSPRTLEWVTIPSPADLPKPGNTTGVSCIAGRFFTNWAIREASNWGGILYFLRTSGWRMIILDPAFFSRTQGKCTEKDWVDTVQISVAHGHFSSTCSS